RRQRSGGNPVIHDLQRQVDVLLGLVEFVDYATLDFNLFWIAAGSETDVPLDDGTSTGRGRIERIDRDGGWSWRNGRLGVGLALGRRRRQRGGTSQSQDEQRRSPCEKGAFQH